MDIQIIAAVIAGCAVVVAPVVGLVLKKRGAKKETATGTNSGNVQAGRDAVVAGRDVVVVNQASPNSTASSDNDGNTYLSQEEIDILAATNERGDIYLLYVSAFGHWVRSGKIDFFKQENLGFNAVYQDALDSLLQRGLVRHEGGHLFRLTGRGFKMAKEVKERRSGEQTKPSD